MVTYNVPNTTEGKVLIFIIRHSLEYTMRQIKYIIRTISQWGMVGIVCTTFTRIMISRIKRKDNE